MDYAELCCRSYYSFLDGASSPEVLVKRAAQLGLKGLALTDTDGLYGVVPFVQAAKVCGLHAVHYARAEDGKLHAGSSGGVASDARQDTLEGETQFPTRGVHQSGNRQRRKSDRRGTDLRHYGLPDAHPPRPTALKIRSFFVDFIPVF